MTTEIESKIKNKTENIKKKKIQSREMLLSG